MDNVQTSMNRLENGKLAVVAQQLACVTWLIGDTLLKAGPQALSLSENIIIVFHFSQPFLVGTPPPPPQRICAFFCLGYAYLTKYSI